MKNLPFYSWNSVNHKEIVTLYILGGILRAIIVTFKLSGTPLKATVVTLCTMWTYEKLLL